MWSCLLCRQKFNGTVLSKVLLAGMSLSVLVGCPSASSDSQNNGGSEQTAEEKENRCEVSLEDALKMLQPENLGIGTGSDSATTLLNKWLSECGTTDELSSPLTATTKTKLKALVSDELLTEISNERFSFRDARHIRDCTISRNLSKMAANYTKNDLERVVSLFYTTTRSIELDDFGAASVPLTTHELLKCGYGTPRDRAWVFAELLRQLHIDAVILTVAADENHKSANAQQESGKAKDKVARGSAWLVGVLLDGKIYLFDMRTGLPMPSKQDSLKQALPQLPATLAEVQTNPELLEQLNVEGDKSYSSAFGDLKSLQIEVISNFSYWKPVNYYLQDSLLGDREKVIYDPLVDDGNGSGLISRVAEAGKAFWKPEQVSLWRYPEQQLLAAENPSDKQKTIRGNLFYLLNAPVKVILRPASSTTLMNDNEQKITPEERKKMANTWAIASVDPKSVLYKSRMHQVVGDTSAAIRSYQRVRLEHHNQIRKIQEKLKNAPLIPEDIPKMQTIIFGNGQAASKAYFWTAVCQIEAREYDTAIVTLVGFSRGKHRFHVDQGNYLLAIAYAESEKYAAAISRLKNVRKISTSWRSAQYLLERFRKIRNRSEKNTAANSNATNKSSSAISKNESGKSERNDKSN